MPSHELYRGLGNLTRAMGITFGDNLRPLTREPLTICDEGLVTPLVVWDSRVGISVGTDRLWRASIAGHRSVFGVSVFGVRSRQSQ